jgi:hypothetical protein
MYNKFINEHIYSGNIYAGITDHLANYALIPSNIKKNKTSERPYIRIFSKRNILIYRDAVSKSSSITVNEDVNIMFNEFYEKLHNVFETSFPCIKQSIKQYKMKPWLTKSILKHIKKKNKAYRKYIELKTEESKLVYKYHKKVSEKIVNTAKQEYYQNQFKSNEKNVKNTWRNINEILGRQSKSADMTEIAYNQKIFDQPKDIARIMNDYFCNIAKYIHDTIPVTNYTYQGQTVLNSLYMDDTCESELIKIINNMKNKSSLGGVDKFSNKYVKCIADIISSPLCLIINKCIQIGKFPEVLKISKVTPIHKNGSKNDPNNFRPISIQSTFSKIFEKVIKTRLQSFIEKNSILSPYQYGFRSKSSTSMALMDLVQSVELNQNSKRHTIIIFLDLKKAFDTVDHNILLLKLEQYGCRGITLQFFASYLANRKQYIKIKNSESPLQEIKYGVPQGSILGPLLFLLYINDIGICKPENGDIKLFADDTAILIAHENLNTLNNIANITLEKTDKWLTMNKQALNNEKTFGMLIHANKKRIENWTPTVTINGTPLQTTHTKKYLGVILDNKLNFQSHTSHLAKKLRKWIGIFKKINPVLTPIAKRTLYFSMFHPNILYGIELYGGVSSTTLKNLQTIQNKAVRSLFGYHRLSPSTEMYKELKLMKIKTLYRYRSAILIHKLLNEPETLNIHSIIKEYCTPMKHKYETRHKSNFNLKFTRSSYTNSSSFKLCLFWNSIPTDIKQNCDYHQFKINICTYILGNGN